MCALAFPHGVILYLNVHSRCCCFDYGRNSEFLGRVFLIVVYSFPPCNRITITSKTAEMADSTEVKLDFTLKELSLRCRTEDVPGSSSTVELRDSRLVCVEYPAVVKSVDKMLETLGGEQTVSKVSAPKVGRLLRLSGVGVFHKINMLTLCV